MPALVVTPSDAYYEFGDIAVTDVVGTRSFRSSVWGRTIVAPTAYSVKRSSVLIMPITGMHPAFYYTGLDYSSSGGSIYARIQQTKATYGVEGSLEVPNPKTENMKNSLKGDLLPITTDYDAMDDVPIHYYGGFLDSKLPNDTTKNNTFLTKVIDESFVKVTMESPYEFSIEVVATPTEDQWFYIPIANAKGLSSTIWGKVGLESTLPAGACAGLIKVYSEAWLTTAQGAYAVTGEQLAALQLGKDVIIDQQEYTSPAKLLPGGVTTYSLNLSGGYYNWSSVSSDVGFSGDLCPDEVKKAATDTFLSIPRIATLNEMIQNQVKWYVLGYNTATCTVGTGLFVRNSSATDGTAQTVVYPYASTTDGISVKRTFTQDIANPVYGVKMGDLLECGSSFMESVAKMAQSGQPVSSGIVLPLCAADLQWRSHQAGPAGSYMTPNVTNYKYPQPSFEGNGSSVLTTPVYIPSPAKYHCFVPNLCSVPVTRYHLLRVSDLGEEVNLGLIFQPELLTNLKSSDSVPSSVSSVSTSQRIATGSNVTVSRSANANAILTAVDSFLSGVAAAGSQTANFATVDSHSFNITQNPELKYANASNPTEGYFYNQAGFRVQRCVSGYMQSSLFRAYSSNLIDYLYNNDDENPVTLTTGDNSFTSYHASRATYKLKYTWQASSGNPVVGKEATTSDKTLGAGVAGMVMVFAGYIPAGSTPGVYMFKPFASTQSISGALSCDPIPTYVDTEVNGTINFETTEAPYVGLNYVYTEGPKLNWEFDTQSDPHNNYSYYRVMLSVTLDKSTVATQEQQVLVAINPEHVALVGYPMASKPVLMQIDDATGVHLHDMEDLCVTNPFYDDNLQAWVVIGASVKHGKMYKVLVEMDATLSFVVDFKTVINSAPLMDTPYGRFTDLLGLCQTKDIHYIDEKTSEGTHATDIVFLVHDHDKMYLPMKELKDNLGTFVSNLKTRGVDDIRIGVACYNIEQRPIEYTYDSADFQWAGTSEQANALLDKLQIGYTGSASSDGYHWSAVQWALQQYPFRDIKSKHIVLVTDSGDMGDPTSFTDIQAVLDEQGIKLDVISSQGAYFAPYVDSLDGTFISSVDSEWGGDMADILSTAVRSQYSIGVANDHLVIYGITSAEESSVVKGSNLVVATCRTTMEWDANKDTIVRIRVDSSDYRTDYVIQGTDKWPHGVAVLFPYIYVLGYTYVNSDSLKGSDSYGIVGENFVKINIAGNTTGWQMCMWKIDITAGIVSDPIIVKDAAAFRYTFGIPACSDDAKNTFRDEVVSVGGKYLALFNIKEVTSSTSTITIATSNNIPSKASQYQFPALSGLCAVAGQLFAFSNYRETPVLLNPLTSTVETTGLSIFPLSYPFDSNIAVKGETLCTMAKFGDVNFYFTQPFYQLCIGDGVSPNLYGMGIDVHDVTTGSTLVRKCYVRNNNLRDRLENIVLSVPPEYTLPGSEMLYLSLTGEDADKSKSITIPNEIHPCETSPFYLHVIPTGTYADENLVLYLNAKFSRVTEYFGYRV